jgi:diguanylate cyclase (GGDEF)-like protein
MLLDATTLMFINAFLAVVGGTLLVLAWFAYRDMKPVLRWAGASFLQGIGLAVLPLSTLVSFDALRPLGLWCLVGSAALLWHAARLLEGYHPRPAQAAAGPLAMIAVILLVPQDQLIGMQAALLLMTMYLLGAGWIISKSAQRLGSRWPLSLLIGGHAVGLAITALAARGDGGLDALTPVLAANLIFLIGTTVFVVAGLRERSEIEQRKLARLDPLTGFYNRGSFFALAETALARCRRSSSPLSVAIVDLDHFKRVNDVFGHAIGDHALTVFADCARRAAIPGAILGRIGGEEFALLLPEVDGGDARALIEDIRRQFQSDAALVGGHPVRATLSAGIGFSPDASMAVADLMQQADGALYEAKAGGRNRVIVAGNPSQKSPAPIVRLA